MTSETIALTALQAAINERSDKHCDATLAAIFSRFTSDLEALAGFDIMDAHREGASDQLKQVSKCLLQIAEKQQNSHVRAEIFAGARLVATKRTLSEVDYLVSTGHLDLPKSAQ